MSKYVTNMVAWCVIALASLVFTCESAAQSTSYEEIEWIQLMPKDDLDALLNPPEYLYEIEDGSEQDTLNSLDAKAFENEQDKRYQQALSSVRVIESYNNKKLRIPGFIVPLESEEGKRISEFFIVPYFGACLHMPPPPPNQIIYVKFDQGVDLKSLYDAFWFEGTLTINTVENELGTSAYQLKLDNVLPYED
ncbi:DUF3299 domain-containing protein [Pseudoalteromonas sp. MMG007]|uniref:DUF3299 domain-containing protein n=1 Tax=Pseudoalteromonas sp. MMG007 TaxID=2822684 RepID=UPI001B39C238|nr:DUF3299 domain-containing protein [Pseudoalteromonas sp. MMG007]MBQ4859348.1 DUF3299 domain-containing protein [Pseudoalteromonas sp. MMG007]